MPDLTDLSPTEMIAEAERRKARRKAGLPLDDTSPNTAVYVHVIEDSFRGFRKVTLPWSVLVPDNERTQPVIRGKRPFLVLTKKYKGAKAEARKIITQAYAHFPPLTCRVSVDATLYEPNASRTRDISNYEKLVHDSLSGLLYVDDGQIDDLRWHRGHPDIDRPRLEISVTEIGK